MSISTDERTDLGKDRKEVELSQMPGPTHATTLTETIPQFEKDLQDVHLIYDYDARTPEGATEKWRYEMWFFSPTRIVYKIHGE